MSNSSFPKPAEATTGGQYREIGLLTKGQKERTSFYNGAEHGTQRLNKSVQLGRQSFLPEWKG